MITFDFETKSYAELKKVGAWCYAEDPTTEIVCCAYGIDAEPIQTWWPGKRLTGPQAWHGHMYPLPMPFDLYLAISAGDTIEAWNVAFERAIWANIMVPTHGWINVRHEQWHDTMAAAAYYALPLGLDQCARALKIGGKNPEGGRLITKYSKLHLDTAHKLKVKREEAGLPHIPDNEWVPWREMTKTERDKNPNAKEDGGYFNNDFGLFVEYCIDDVKNEQDVSDFLGDLPAQEQEIFHLDQKINLRGIKLDEVSISNARHVAEQRAQDLSEEFFKLTGYKPSQTVALMDWFKEQGYDLDNMQADYLESVLEGDEDVTLEGDALKAVRLRLKFNKASTKKLDAMLRQRAKDGRAKFQMRYHGASTGRWTGSGFQPLNLVKSYEKVPPDRLVADISFRDAEYLDMVYGDAMEAVSKASRHHIIAEKGHRIIAGDFVSIEAVLLACTAEETWKVEAFQRGDPIYELMGCKIHNLPDEAVALAKKDKQAFKDKYPVERFDGKTGELAFGYQGALGAWRKFDSSDRYTDEHIIENICKPWRQAHPAITQYWKDLEWAAKQAVDNPGKEFGVGPIGFKVIDEWLSMELPNGKRIWYYEPKLKLGWPQWHKPKEYDECADGTCDCKKVLKLCYMAQKEGQWRVTYTYGGKLAENATQATSREVLVPAMKRLEAAGYPIVLTVYDEIVCEVPDGFGDVKEFQEIMRELPGDWAKGWPINVDVWEGERYRK